jgi:MoaA/NifB/PqqE/SkfB family radical SAM enzyme
MPVSDPCVGPERFMLDSIDLYVNARCNRRCSYCFLPDEFLDSGQQMSLEVAEAILAWCGGRAREATLLGGEPSLHPALPVIAHAARRQRMAVRVVTNGSLPFRRLLDDQAFVADLDSVAVSLDHFDADIVRILRGRHGAEDATLTIERLRALDLRVAVNCTVTSLLANEIEAMIEYVESLGAFRLNLHWLSPVGRARAQPNLLVGPSAWRGVLDKVAAYTSPRADFQVDCEVGWLYDDLPSTAEPFACAARERSNLQFMPDGRVFSCGLVVESSELHGYEWREGRLWRRAGTNSELDIVDRASCRGCPLRTLHSDYRVAGDATTAPACIYQRVHAQSSERSLSYSASAR